MEEYKSLDGTVGPTMKNTVEKHGRYNYSIFRMEDGTLF